MEQTLGAVGREIGIESWTGCVGQKLDSIPTGNSEAGKSGQTGAKIIANITTTLV